MSPWLREELRVVVGPDRLALLPVRRTLTAGGVRRSIHDPLEFSVDPGLGEPSWQSALRSLEAALADVAPAGMAATVILSNRFMRYAVVPWRDELADGEEELAYTRHWLAGVYGKHALTWELRLSRQGDGLPWLAAAVDAELLAGLRDVFERSGVRLRSVQPHLMAAANGALPRLRQCSGWLALLEPRHVCLALVREGRWARVCGQRLERSWPLDLVPLLERESILAGEPAVPNDVYVADLESDQPQLPQQDPWQFRALACAATGGAAAAGPSITASPG